jgi:hypothetical protein
MGVSTFSLSGCGDEPSVGPGPVVPTDAGADCHAADGACGPTDMCEGSACQDAADEDGGAETGACAADDAAVTLAPKTARSAQSTGYSGSADAYAELFDVTCQTPADCEKPCLDRGGQKEMCAASECASDFDAATRCVPPPVWTNLAGIQSASDVLMDAVQLITVSTPYHDRLVVNQFKLEVPPNAVIRGITVEIRKAAESSVSDDSVKIVKGGKVGDAERASSTEWPTDLTWATYGGATDSWGESWTAADLNADDFGVAISARYGKTVGNARAYIDQVRVTVQYTPPCGS